MAFGKMELQTEIYQKIFSEIVSLATFLCPYSFTGLYVFLYYQHVCTIVCAYVISYRMVPLEFISIIGPPQ